MRKWAKITIKIGWVIFCLITLIVGLVLWLCFKFDLHTGYIRRNPTKRIAYLERVCDINFPECIKEVQIATSWLGWDAWYTTYLIKFRIEPNSLESLVKTESLRTYEPDSDERFRGLPHLPKWFIKPIRVGKMGDIHVSFTKEAASAKVNIYVDTSKEKSFIVYMYGTLPPWP